MRNAVVLGYHGSWVNPCMIQCPCRAFFMGLSSYGRSSGCHHPPPYPVHTYIAETKWRNAAVLSPALMTPLIGHVSGPFSSVVLLDSCWRFPWTRHLWDNAQGFPPFPFDVCSGTVAVLHPLSLFFLALIEYLEQGCVVARFGCGVPFPVVGALALFSL